MRFFKSFFDGLFSSWQSYLAIAIVLSFGMTYGLLRLVPGMPEDTRFLIAKAVLFLVAVFLFVWLLVQQRRHEEDRK